jgi:hypothetical protein
MGNELAVIEHQQQTESAPLTALEIKGQVKLIQDVMTGVMKKDEHYGVIPGCGTKPSLLKPGAEKLCMTFRLAPRFVVTPHDFPNGHREYHVQTMLYHIRTGAFWGEGVGMCSTLETKYRYRDAKRKCPVCGKEAIIKGKEDMGGGWICWNKRGGCGSKFSDAAEAIINQPLGKIENENIADAYNTVEKMAKKRSLVDAVLTATAASDIFTQDVEEIIENEQAGQPQGESPPKQDAPKTQPPKGEKPDIYAIITFGKYKGETWASLGQTTDGRKYLHWVTEPDKATGKVKYPESAAQARAALDKWKAQEQEPPSGVLEGEIPADPDNFINQ